MVLQCIPVATGLASNHKASARSDSNVARPARDRSGWGGVFVFSQASIDESKNALVTSVQPGKCLDQITLQSTHKAVCEFEFPLL